MLKTRIFISAVTRELGSARQLVANTLTALGYEPIWQDIFPTDAGDLRQILQNKIDSCSAVLQLVGDAYGAEPPTINHEYGRVSYTQFEAIYAEKSKVKVYYLFLEKAYPHDGNVESIDKHPGEQNTDQFNERQRLQALYKEKVRESGKLRSKHSSVPELENGIFRLRDDLDRLRRRTKLILIGIFALLIVITGGIYFIWNAQNKHTQSIDTQTTKIAGLSQEQKQLYEIVRELPNALNKASSISQLDPQQRMTEALRILEADFKLPTGTLKSKFPKLAEEILVQGNATSAERASALYLQHKYREGEDVAIQAIDELQAMKPVNEKELLKLYLLAGTCAGYQKAYGRELEYYLSASKLTNPKTDFDQWASLQNMIGMTLIDMRDFQSAVLYLSKLSEQTRYQYGLDHVNTIRSINTMGIAYHKEGQFVKAEDAYLQAIDLYEKKVGKDDVRTLTSMANLAFLYQFTKQFKKSSDLYEKVYEKYKTLFGLQNERTIITAVNLGMAYTQGGEGEKGIKLLQDAVEMSKVTFGPDHRETLFNTGDLALGYVDVGDLDKAIETYTQVLETRKKLLGPTDPDTITSYRNLLGTYRQKKDYEKALKLTEELYTFCKNILTDNNPLTISYQSELALATLDAGHLAQAVPLAEAAYEKMKALKGPDDYETSICLQNYAETLMKNQQYAPAIERYSELLARDKKYLNSNAPRIDITLALIGQAQLKLEKYADAEATLAECWNIRKRLVPKFWETFNAQSMLGEALLGQKKYDAAEPLLIEAYEGMIADRKNMPSKAEERIGEAIDRLVKFYTLTDKPDEVAKWKGVKEKYLEEQKSKDSTK